MTAVGYLPFGPTGHSVEAAWLAERLTTPVTVVHDVPALNDPSTGLPPRRALDATVAATRDLDHLVVEGPAGLLWAAVLREAGFTGALTILAYLNPTRWHDVAAATLSRGALHPESDRVFVGSSTSAAIYGALGVPAITVGEPFGIDDSLFHPGPATGAIRDELAIPPGPLLLFAGRAEADKDIFTWFRVAFHARVLFPDLQIVIAANVVDDHYLSPVRSTLGRDPSVHIVSPQRNQLADLYREADVFFTASTSHYETFGRAPVEALAAGTPVVAPRFDGFAETLRQPGATLVDVVLDDAGEPRLDEAAALRAVYDALTSAAQREHVAAAAHPRFARSQTIGLLDHIVGRGPIPPTSAVARPDLTLPAEWNEALSGLAGCPLTEGLDRYWNRCPHEELSAHDAELRTNVRRALCTPAQDGVVTSCR